MSVGQEPDNKNLAYYRQRFSELNPSKNKKKESGNAPYKPILLLSVIDLITQGLIQDNRIPVSDDLIDTFNRYWQVLASDSSYKGGLHYPFLYLQSEEFWYVKFKPEFQGLQPKTTNKLKEAVEYAHLDNQLFDLLQDEISRQELIDTLIAVWFSVNQKELAELLQVNQNFQDFTQTELSNPENEPKFILRRSVVRKAVFRKAIVQIYDYRCAFCRLKSIRAITQNIVDGAHIKPYSEYYDNSVGNGISFCKNHHWGFDHGWFCIDDNYKIIVASDLQEESPYARPMREFHGETILLPSSEEYFPSPEALRWHRKTWLRKA